MSRLFNYTPRYPLAVDPLPVLSFCMRGCFVLINVPFCWGLVLCLACFCFAVRDNGHLFVFVCACSLAVLVESLFMDESMWCQGVNV